jgi:tetratricopeptide (TPR) repeat protein
MALPVAPKPPPRSRLPALVAVWLVAIACQVLVQTLQVAQAFADAPPDEAELRKAEALATEAKVFFKAKLYDKAAGRFMEAYAISRRPSLMYNAARAYEEGRNLREAHALFQEYRKLPDVGEDGRKDADARIARLEADMQAADAEARAREEKKVEPHVEPKVEPKIEPRSN